MVLFNRSLSMLQAEIQQILLSPRLQEQQQDFVNKEINSSARMSAKAHLGIYQRSYVMRLQQCMANQFSALKFALGDEIFQLFVQQYLHSYPSKHYSLNNLGDDFSQFLQQTRPDAEQEVKEDWPDFMIELADFEADLNHLFDQEIPDSVLDHEQIQAKFDTPDKQLSLVPVCKLLCHKHPILEYYRAFNAQQQPELAQPKTSYGLIIRRNYRLGLIDLNYGQHLFIKTLLNEQDIAKTKQVLIKQNDYCKPAIEELWQHWRKYLIAQGVFNQ